MEQKLYWSKFFQMSDDVERIEEVLKSMPFHDAVAHLGDTYDGYESCEDDFITYEPYCANNGTDIFIASANGYTLIYNATLGGDYLLYREARPDEIDWWNDRGPGSMNHKLNIS